MKCAYNMQANLMPFFKKNMSQVCSHPPKAQCGCCNIAYCIQIFPMCYRRSDDIKFCTGTSRIDHSENLFKILNYCWPNKFHKMHLIANNCVKQNLNHCAYALFQPLFVIKATFKGFLSNYIIVPCQYNDVNIAIKINQYRGKC